MKRSSSEFDLQDFLRNLKTMNMTTFSISDDDAVAAGIIVDPPTAYSFTATTHLSDSFPFKEDQDQEQDQEVINDFSSNDRSDIFFSHNLTPKTAIQLDSQSSICGNVLSSGSPVSAGNYNPNGVVNEVRGATSASSDDEEEEEAETEAGQSEQSLDPSNLKRLRRMLSNRESARRSRKRKQEHLTDLELQAERMRGEKDSLYKQLANAHQLFRDADTNNRVLKSDVEALRAKVKLAEDMLARGSLTCSLNQLVQSHLTAPPPLAIHNLRRVANVSPTITVNGDDSSSYAGLAVSGFANVDISNGNLNNGDAVSCVSEIWR